MSQPALALANDKGIKPTSARQTKVLFFSFFLVGQWAKFRIASFYELVKLRTIEIAENQRIAVKNLGDL